MSEREKITQDLKRWERSLLAAKLDRRYEELNRIYNNMGMLYERLGHYKQSLECHEKELRLSVEYGSTEDVAVACRRVGDLNKALNRFPEAITAYFQQMETAEKLKLLKEQQRALACLGDVYRVQGDAEKEKGGLENAKESWDMAESYLLKSVVYAERVESTDPERLEMIQNAKLNLGLLKSGRGSLKDAVGLMMESLEIATRRGDLGAQSLVLHNLCIELMNLEQYEKAIENAERMLDIAQELSDVDGETNALWTMGEASRNMRRYVDAAQYFRRYGEKTEDDASKEQAREMVVDAERFAKAEQEINRLLAELESEPRKQEKITMLSSLGNLFLQIDEPTKASDHFRATLELIAESDVEDWALYVRAISQLIISLQQAENWTSALPYCLEFAERAKARGESRTQARSLLELSTVREHLDDVEEARDALSECLSIARDAELVKYQREALEKLVPLCQREGDDDAADEFQKQLSRVPELIDLTTSSPLSPFSAALAAASASQPGTGERKQEATPSGEASEESSIASPPTRLGKSSSSTASVQVHSPATRSGKSIGAVTPTALTQDSSDMDWDPERRASSRTHPVEFTEDSPQQDEDPYRSPPRRVRTAQGQRAGDSSMKDWLVDDLEKKTTPQSSDGTPRRSSAARREAQDHGRDMQSFRMTPTGSSRSAENVIAGPSPSGSLGRSDSERRRMATPEASPNTRGESSSQSKNRQSSRRSGIDPGGASAPGSLLDLGAVRQKESVAEILRSADREKHALNGCGRDVEDRTAQELLSITARDVIWSIDLSANRFLTMAGISALVNNADGFESLRVLNLTATAVGADGFAQLVNAVVQHGHLPQLRELNFGYNAIGESNQSAAESVASLLACDRPYITVDLTRNFLSSVFLGALVDAFKRLEQTVPVAATVRRLLLTRNLDARPSALLGSERAVDSLLELVRCVEGLEHVDVRLCGINPYHIPVIEATFRSIILLR